MQSSTTAERPGLIGQRVKRTEDNRLTTGAADYIGDLTMTDTLHVKFVRSEFARARIRSVNIDHDAAAAEGVRYYLGSHFAEYGVRSYGEHPSWQECTQPLLADQETRYVGEPLVAVLHWDPYWAEDALETVSIGYDESTPVVDLTDAVARDAPKVHTHWNDNLFMRRSRVFGDMETARENATHVVRRSFRMHRQAGVPLENRGCLARPDSAGDGVTLWTSTQVPHLVRTYVAKELGIPEHSVSVIAPDVGGGFGVKGHVFPEEVLITKLALETGRPVKWVEDRLEHLQSSIHARDHLHTYEAYVGEHGRILGLKVQIVVDSGAYSVFPWTAGSDNGMAAKVLLGVYDIHNYEVEDMAVATNKCPLGTYRGVGRPGAVFSIERLMDEIAHEINIDPLDVRRANVITEFPHTTPTGLEYDPGSYRESLEKAAEVTGYANRQPSAPDEDGRYRRGWGIALYNEQAGHGTRDFATRGGPIETGYESAHLSIDPSGFVLANTGMQSHGQGMETTFAQVIADELGVPFDSIRVKHGDTRTSPYCVGTWGSRGAALGGGAVGLAAVQLKQKLLDIGAWRLEASAEDLVLSDGVVSVQGVPGISVTVAELAYSANRTVNDLPPGMSPGLETTSYVDGPGSGTFSNACHMAVVDVDTVTGLVHIARYVVVEDCGRVINPMIVDGQVQGGVTQGIGTALLEEISYSSDGQPQEQSFKDYLLPNASVVPEIEVYHIETLCPNTRNGVKGMGESGAIGPPAAVANAVTNAVGVPMTTTPLRPARVWHQIQAGDTAADEWNYYTSLGVLDDFWAVSR